MAKIPRDIEAAIAAAQRYIGCDGKVNIRDQQRLYDRMMAKIDSVVKKRSLDRQQAHETIVGEAKKRGGVCPIPGKDM